MNTFVGQQKWTKWAQTTSNHKNNKYLDFYIPHLKMMAIPSRKANILNSKFQPVLSRENTTDIHLQWPSIPDIVIHVMACRNSKLFVKEVSPIITAIFVQSLTFGQPWISYKYYTVYL